MKSSEKSEGGSVGVSFAYINLDNIYVVEEEIPSKKQVLSWMSHRLSEMCRVGSDVILHTILEREKLGSTTLGHGCAVPHGYVKRDSIILSSSVSEDSIETNRISGIFVRLRKAVDFSADDNIPVDLLFMLLAEKELDKDGDNELALAALLDISYIFRDSYLCDCIRKADSREEIYRLLNEVQGEEARSVMGEVRALRKKR